MKQLTNSQKQAAQNVAQLITKGLEAWFEAGQIVAEEVDKDEAFIEVVCDSCPAITPQILWRFYAIGKKQIVPELLLSDSPGCRRLIKLPYDLQKKYLEQPIPVLVRGDRGFDVLNISVRDLTPDQAKQAIDSDCIRSQSAQRAFIESENMKAAAPEAALDTPWKIIGKKLVVKKDVTLSARELAKILSEMES